MGQFGTERDDVSGPDGSDETAAEILTLLNLVRRYMSELDWSYKMLERKTGVSRSTWNRWYTQKKLPKRDALVGFAAAAPHVVNRDELLGLWDAAWQAQEAEQARSADRVPAADEQAERQTTATPVMTPTPEQQPSAETTPQTEAKKQARKKTGWVLAGIMSAVLLGGAAGWVINAGADDSANPQGTPSSASPTTSKATAALATCHNDSCASVEPKETICSQDATTAYTAHKFGVTIELRYSPRCDAAWAKMSNASPGDRVIITPARGDSEEYRQQYGHDAHTRMAPAIRPEDARACAKIEDRGTVCATTPASSSPTPG